MIRNGAVSIEIDRHVPTIAPAQVWVKARDYSGLSPFEERGSVYDGAHHEYYHLWTINGQPLTTFQSPKNMLREWNNPNKAYGREVAFCLTDAGNYTIDLVVIDQNGITAKASSTTIKVIPPESHFVDTDRIYVDLDGEYPNKPATSIGVSSLDGLKLALERASTPPWVLFERGEEYDFGTLDISSASNTGWLRVSSARPFAYMSAYGAGPKPVLKPSTRPGRNQQVGLLNFWNTTPMSHVVVRDLRFTGRYDPATETGDPGQGSCIELSNLRNTGTFFTFYNLSVSGMDKGFQLQNNGSDLRVMVVDCDVSDWRDYAVIGGESSTKLSLIGNRLAQNVYASHGGDKGDALVSTHGPVRVSNAKTLYIAQNDLFSRCGWSGALRGQRDDQPCLRLFTVPNINQFGIVERNVMEGGYHIVNHESANPHRDPSTPGNLVIERNLMLATAKNFGTFVSSWRSGVTIRNNIMIYPAVPTIGNGTEALKFSLAGIESSDNSTNPIRIYSNTYYNAMNARMDNGGSFAPFVNRNDIFTNFTQENNLWHKPANSKAINAGNIDVSEYFQNITPRFFGTRYGFDLPEIKLPAGGLPNETSLALPYSLFTQKLQDGSTLGDNATDQAYWQINGGTKHAIYVYGDKRRLYAQHGHLAVHFDVSHITLINTSGIDWGKGGERVRLHLDRVAAIPAMNRSYTSPNAIPIPRPQNGSTAYQSAIFGLCTPQDFKAQGPRLARPSRGALEP